MSGIIVLILRVLLTISLYGFLGWALFTIWRELQMHTNKVLPEHPPEITIKVDEEREKTFSISEFSIGREDHNDLILIDETISSTHVKLSYHNEHWWVEDLQSTNGTFLNEERVYTPTILINGDNLILGKIVLEITITEK